MTFHNPDGAGKGDRPRPIPDRKQYDENWDRIFRRQKRESEEKNND